MKRGSSKWKDPVLVRTLLVVPIAAEEELELRAGWEEGVKGGNMGCRRFGVGLERSISNSDGDGNGNRDEV